MEEAAPPSAVCHSVFGNNPLHFSRKMGKQSVISPITPSLQRRPGGVDVRGEWTVWRAAEMQQ